MLTLNEISKEDLNIRSKTLYNFTLNIQQPLKENLNIAVAISLPEKYYTDTFTLGTTQCTLNFATTDKNITSNFYNKVLLIEALSAKKLIDVINNIYLTDFKVSCNPIFNPV